MDDIIFPYFWVVGGSRKEEGSLGNILIDYPRIRFGTYQSQPIIVHEATC